jgi:pyruvate/2-oxoglutarate dehydrogenase complex dihydrolipoamide acyltransferase (E2) component
MRAFVLLVLLAGCAETGAAKPQASAASPEATVSAPQFSRTATPAATAAPTATASAAPTAEPTVAVPDVKPPEPPKPPPPLPDVEVKNVGMHIGGGPNDNVTKRPIREAVKLHFDDLRECYAKALSPKDKETFGVDIRIPGDGGKAKITKPRTAMKGEGIVECMVGVFETVEFSRPPKGNPMTVSFSVEFTKKSK